MSLAIALETVMPGAYYHGSLTADTPEAYAAIQWLDSRPKPSYEKVLAATQNVVKDVLKAYAAKRRYKRQAAGYTYQGIHFDADANAVMALTMAFSLAKANPSYNTQWKIGNNTFTPLSAPKILGLYGAITGFVQALFNAEAVVVAAIEAGSVTKQEEVLAAINSVSNSS